MKSLVDESEIFARYLQRKFPPTENGEKKELAQTLLNEILKKEGKVNIDSESEEIKFKEKINNKLQSSLKRKIYNWKPIDYKYYNALLYLFARSAPEYAVLTKIFTEIFDRDKEFKPRSLFDFGSGVGTVTWY